MTTMAESRGAAASGTDLLFSSLPAFLHPIAGAERRCVACETSNPARSKFCHECGHPLSAGTSLGSPAAGRQTESGEACCDRRNVTMLIADVSGFTAMSERMDPEEVFAIVERASALILDEAARRGGRVNQFLGDGAMVLFGETDGDGYHAERAVETALAIQAGLEGLREDVRRAHGLELRMRISVHTGPIAIGVIRHGLRTDYTAAGSTANRALDLLRVARPGQIVLSQQTHRLVAGSFVTEDLGDIALVVEAGPLPLLAAA